MGLSTSKIKPARQELIEERLDDEKIAKEAGEMHVMSLHVLLKRYGAQRRPRLDPFETLMSERLLRKLAFVPRGSVIIYISHQWVGFNHPDPCGDQMYHLLLLLERLLRGDVSRTDMDAFHSLVYKHNYNYLVF